ncbi:hypothetical protein LZ009_09605 [Ramlibacter sp. XY19]|uniref:hypothetical protein n=1 Tax=Ramlibacter paludis TaxID=2908000 RepID=UPI0023DB1103|nr:hypothetical protein [Ramlibacter paludis]MCG2593035.1 hypothetical protein [Ramlibacter paludis]
MKFAYALIPLAAFAFLADAQAQGRIFRCGNSNYTNDEAHAKANNCKPVEGGNVTVVQGTKVNGAGKAVSVANAPQAAGSAGQKVDSADQRLRDAEARNILEAELKKAEARQGELLKEYNNGEPEKLGPEHRNYQKYLDRVADLKAAIDRNEKDIAGLKRELGRSSGTASK